MYSKFQLGLKYLSYYFSASNSKGHGMHSPFVFEFITKVLNDKTKYEAYEQVENLRQQLAVDFNSTLAINGCRVDTDYRATGGYGCYIIELGKQATNSVSLFDPTKDIDKLCTVDVHKAAYKTWLKSLGFDMTDDD